VDLSAIRSSWVMRALNPAMRYESNANR